nr:tetratricopeptide repeat protein [uncultured Pseudodesulfovibrio sp.]
MGVHKKNRELEELKAHYMKKSSAIFLAIVALLVGAFIGNTVTSLYMGQQQARTGGAVPQQQQSDEPHQANPVALANLEKAAADDPTNADKWIELGNFCFDHDLSAQAVTAYERALELAPMQVNVWSDLGVMYRRTKQYEKAVEAFGHAASLDPQHITSRFNMGIVYMYDLNDQPSAVKVWKGILAIDPNAKTPSGESLAAMVNDLEK